MVVGGVDSAPRGFFCNFAERHLGRSLQFVGANCVRPTKCDVISRNGLDRSD